MADINQHRQPEASEHQDSVGSTRHTFWERLNGVVDSTGRNVQGAAEVGKTAVEHTGDIARTGAGVLARIAGTVVGIGEGVWEQFHKGRGKHSKNT